MRANLILTAVVLALFAGNVYSGESRLVVLYLPTTEHLVPRVKVRLMSEATCREAKPIFNSLAARTVAVCLGSDKRKANK